MYLYKTTIRNWVQCVQIDIDKLEKVQLYAARIVTGRSILASTDFLYFETGWETLIMIRDRLELSAMFKIHNNHKIRNQKCHFPLIH